MKKLWDFIVKHWKAFWVLLGAIATALILTKIVGSLKALLADNTFNPSKFRKLDDTHVAVKTDDGWKSVDVAPLGIKADQVEAVEVIDGGPVKVVKKNVSIDDIGRKP